MKTLFIDTHYMDIIIALLDNETIISKKEVINKKNNSEFIFPTIIDVIKDENIKVGDGVSTFAQLGYTTLGSADLKAGVGIEVGSDGSISIADSYTNDILSSASGAAERASSAAVTAGNYAAQAIQAQQAIDRKIWYGTMAEYNALESVSNSTIYIILHE